MSKAVLLNCPCYDCICIPICRHKTYTHLFGDCSMITSYVADNDPMSIEYIVTNIQSVLKPTIWEYSKKGALLTQKVEGDV